MPVPENLDWPEAGGCRRCSRPPTTPSSRQAGCRPGERLLVHGGAGGVGTAAIQLGARPGARVTATVRNPGLRDGVAAFGADRDRAGGLRRPRPVRRDPRARRRAQPAGQPQGAATWRPDRRDRDRRRRQSRGSTSGADGQARRGSTARRCARARSRRRRCRPGGRALGAAAARVRRRPGAGRRDLPAGRGRRRPTTASRPAASSARSSLSRRSYHRGKRRADLEPTCPARTRRTNANRRCRRDALLQPIGDTHSLLDLDEFRVELLAALGPAPFRRAGSSLNDISPDPTETRRPGRPRAAAGAAGRVRPLRAPEPARGVPRTHARRAPVAVLGLRLAARAPRARSLHRRRTRKLGVEYQIAFTLPSERGRVPGSL